MSAAELGLPTDGQNVRFRNMEWKVVRKIYDGVFSQVFMLQDVADQKKFYAMKVEKQVGCVRPVLKLDVRVLSEVQGARGFPALLTAGRTNQFKFCVMQFVGPELGTLQRLMPDSRFSRSTAYRVALQTLDRIETLHRHGWINRDVKAANFAVGLGSESNIVYMLDFGLTRKFRNADHAIRARRPIGPCVGTYQFGSLAAAYLWDQTPKDDLEGWMYMVIHMLQGSLPWYGGSTKWLDHGCTREFKEHSRKSYRSEFFQSLPNEWEKIHDTIVNLRFDEVPPYALCRALIHNIVQRENIDFAQPFDWQVVPRLVKEMSYLSTRDDKVPSVHGEPTSTYLDSVQICPTALETPATMREMTTHEVKSSPDVGGTPSSFYAWKSDIEREPLSDRNTVVVL